MRPVTTTLHFPSGETKLWRHEYPPAPGDLLEERYEDKITTFRVRRRVWILGLHLDVYLDEEK